MSNPMDIVVALLAIAVFIATCILLEERVTRATQAKRNPRPAGGTFLFGRRYYSLRVVEWEGHGIGHAHRMTGIERARYGQS